MAAFTATAIFLWVNRSLIEAANVEYLDSMVSSLIYIPLATLLTYRRPQNPISWLLALFVLLRLFSFPRYFILISLYKGLELTPVLLFVLNFWPMISGLAFTFLAYTFVVFPDGELYSGRWRLIRWLVRFQVLLIAVEIILYAFEIFRNISIFEGGSAEIILMPIGENGLLSLILHVRALPWFQYFFLISAVLVLVVIISGLISLIMRFRRGNSVERQQIKWVIFVMLIWIFSVISLIFPFENNLFILPYVGPLPGVAITLAVLRYRLYDIDIIINRTLVYGSLSASLLLIYFGSVVILENITRNLTGTRSPLATVIATLLIAALFQPIRQRLQGWIDRAFFRSKYDAEKMLQSFAATARDEVSISRLSRALLVTVEDAVRPTHLSLMLRSSVEKTSRLEQSGIDAEGRSI